MDLGNRLLESQCCWTKGWRGFPMPICVWYLRRNLVLLLWAAGIFDGRLQDAESNRRTPWSLNLLPFYLLQLYLVYRQTRQHIL